MKKKPPEKPSPFAALQDLRDKMAKEAKEAEDKARAAPSRTGGTGAAPRGSPPKTQARGAGSHGGQKAGASGASTGDDLDFHRLMSGVTPLDEKKTRVPKSDIATEGAGRTRRATPVAADETMEHLRVLVEEGSKFEVSDDGRRVEGHRVDVPPEFVRKLRRGGFPVDGSLDLHGRTAEESKDAIATFLRDKRARGERCVLIVHGKGLHSAGGAPVLRGEITAWLSQGAASNHVAAFATALDEDGGSGAVYVLLRR